MRAYYADLTVYDPSIAGERVLRYATAGRVTEPTDTPPNEYYADRMSQPALLSRNVFAEGATFGRTRLGYGEVELRNEDGSLDALRTYGFDGRRILIRAGEHTAAFSALETALVGTMEGAEVGDVVRIRLRERILDLEVPLQANLYAGTNDLPNGLEGTSELTGKPKPRCFGVVTNVPAILVNSAKLIYQVHDGPISSIDVVYDRGSALVIGAAEWDSQTSGFGSDVILGVAYGGGVYVAVGAAAKLFSSTDAIAWTSRTSTFTADNIWGVAYGNSLFVAVGAAGKLATSPDGTTWTARTSSFAGSEIISGIAYSDDLALWVACGDNGKVATSPDGITWTQRTSAFSGAFQATAVAWGAGVFVVVGQNGQIQTSPDGIAWTLHATHPFGTRTVEGVAFGDGIFLAVGGTAATIGIVASSVDGAAWADRGDATFGTNTINAVVYGLGFWMIGGGGGTANGGNLAYSRDTVIWYKPNASDFDGTGGHAVQQLALGNNLFVAVGSTGKLMTTKRSGTTYDDQSDLLNDGLAPAPGTFKYWPDGGMFRLAALPDGLITADVTEGKAAADRRAGRIIRRILWNPMGRHLIQWNDDDLDTLDTTFTGVLGLWVGPDPMSVAQTMDLIAASPGAWWNPDRLGVIRVKQFTAPSGATVLSLVENQIIGLERIPPTDRQGRGIPPWRSIVRYGRYYVVQVSDVAGGVTPARMAELAREWREAKAEDDAVQTKHPLAPEIVEDSQIAIEADAQTEATRRQTLRGTLRDVFRFQVQLNTDTDGLDLGDVISLTHSRYSLSAGASVRIIGLEPDAKNERISVLAYK